MRFRTAIKVGGLTLILAGVGLWIWGQFDGPVGESIAGAALAAVVIGVVLLTHILRIHPIEEAYDFGYDTGYERGYKVGRAASRPTVVSICDTPTKRAGRQARRRERKSSEGDHA